jgi:Zn-dependent membrane protease YugP
MYYFGIDWTFIAVMIPFIIITFIMHGILTHTYFVYLRAYPLCGLNGAQTARKILDDYGLDNVEVMRSDGELSDHYDPNMKAVRLSFDTYSGRGISAIGVAAHEAGHAIQDSLDYMPYRIRHIVNRITKIGNDISIPLIAVGVFLELKLEFGIWIAYIGAACYALSTVLQLATLHAEFDATKKGLWYLEAYNILEPDEMPAARSVMKCAAVTNVVFLAVTIINVILHSIAAGLSGSSRGRDYGGSHAFNRYNNYNDYSDFGGFGDDDND